MGSHTDTSDPAHRNQAEVNSMADRLITQRLMLRPWRVDDAPSALQVYGHAAVTRWLSPAMERVPDRAAMRKLLLRWIAEDGLLVRPASRWAIQRRQDGRVIGGASLLPLPPGDEDLEISWQIHPDLWGRGYASESMYALATWAFAQQIDEIFAIVRPENTRAAITVRRNGMQWVGETNKYFGMTLQVYRLRAGDLDRWAPDALKPPRYDLG
jgi:RimJ/RimL family protein N-acetyltransferase